MTVTTGGRASRSSSSSSLTSEYRVAPLAQPTAEFEVLWPRESGVEYHINLAILSGHEHWVVTHNQHGPNFCVSTAPVGQLPPLRDLDVLVPHSEIVRIEGVDRASGAITAAGVDWPHSSR